MTFNTNICLTIKMTDSEDILTFWDSIIRKEGLTSHVSNLAAVSDSDERGIALLSRIMLLWTMGIKYERDEFGSIVQKMICLYKNDPGNSGSCIRCSDIKVLLKDIEASMSSAGKESDEKLFSPSPHKSRKVLHNIDNSPDNLNRRILVPESQPVVKDTYKENEYPQFIPETLPMATLQFSPDKSRSPISSEENQVLETSPILGKQGKISQTPKSKKVLLFNRDRVQCSQDEVLGSSEKDCSNQFQTAPIGSPESPFGGSPSVLRCHQSYINTPETTGKSKHKCSDNENSNKSYLNKTMLFTSRKTTSNSLGCDSGPNITKNTNTLTTSFESNKKVTNPLSSSSETREKVAKPLSLSKLRRVKTEIPLKSSMSGFQVDLTSSGKKLRKNYRQTTISKDGFLKKTNVGQLSVVGSSKSVDVKKEEKLQVCSAESEDENEILNRILEESVRTKEIEDILRKNYEQLKKESPLKFSPNKEATTKRKKAQFIQKSEYPSTSNVDTSRVTEDEILAELDKTSPNVSPDKLAEKEEENGKARRLRKRPLTDDSFDILAPKTKEPNFAHKQHVVRNKKERKKLDGWDCKECCEFYGALGLSDEEKKAALNRCSRHRSKYKPVTNTPEGFWNLNFDDDNDNGF